VAPVRRLLGRYHFHHGLRLGMNKGNVPRFGLSESDDPVRSEKISHLVSSAVRSCPTKASASSGQLWGHREFLNIGKLT
jgi:hypothetical protein